jgi:AcrR family transcriptional regulator
MLSSDNSPRQRTVAAAFQVLREAGPDGFSTRAVAERAGVTQPALYRHFADKDALYAEVMREARARFRDRFLDAVENAPTPRSRLLAGLDAFRSFSVDEPGLHDAIFSSRPKADGADGAAARDGIFRLLVDRVAEAIAERELAAPDATSAALMLAALVRGLAALHRRGRFSSETHYAEFYRTACETMLRGLG